MKYAGSGDGLSRLEPSTPIPAYSRSVAGEPVWFDAGGNRLLPVYLPKGGDAFCDGYRFSHWEFDYPQNVASRSGSGI